MQYERFLHKKVDTLGKSYEQQIFLVDMKEDSWAGVFSTLTKKTLQSYLPKGKKVLILGWKDWVSTGVQCKDCGFIPKCIHCDIPIAYHRDQAWQTFWLCHICKTSYPAIVSCGNCGSYEIEFFWTWLQKIQEMVLQIAPECKITTITSANANSLPKIQKLTEQIAQTQCIIATPLLQIAPVGWSPDAVVVIHADSSLAVPDWKVGEHCYYTLDAIIKNYACPTIFQVYNTQHHAIQAACKQDEEFFWKEENAFREGYVYPPYGQLAVLLYKHEIESTMFTRVHKLYQELLFLQKQDNFDGEIFATPPLVYKMFDKYRYNIVVKWKQIRPFLEKAFVDLKIRDRGFKIDWLPENIT